MVLQLVNFFKFVNCAIVMGFMIEERVLLCLIPLVV